MKSLLSSVLDTILRPILWISYALFAVPTLYLLDITYDIPWAIIGYSIYTIMALVTLHYLSARLNLSLKIAAIAAFTPVLFGFINNTQIDWLYTLKIWVIGSAIAIALHFVRKFLISVKEFIEFESGILKNRFLRRMFLLKVRLKLMTGYGFS